MKKHNIIFSLLLVTFFALIFIRYASAWILAPYFDLTVKVETDGADDTFPFTFTSVISGSGGDTQSEAFSVTTASSTGEYLFNGQTEDNTSIVFKWEEMPGWKIDSWSCSSGNPEITFTSNEPGVIRIAGRAYSEAECNIKFVQKQKNPVIIIPGILASQLNRNDDEKTELWPNLKKIILNLGRDKFLDELSLNKLGQINFSNPLVLPTDIIRSIGDKDFFTGLIQELESVGYVENENLFVFPYDWRLDIRNSVDNLPSEVLVTLKEKIDSVIQETGSHKVDIIAHSMGGLLTKYFINKYGIDGGVDKFIDIGTPHLGAPNAFKTIFAGDNLGIKFGFLGLNSLEVKKITQNMSAIYQLLPSENYLADDLPDYRYFIYDMVDYDGDGVRGRLSFGQSLDFLKNTGANDVLLDTVTHIHDDLDGQTFNPEQIKTYNLVGCGTPTIGKFFITGRDRKGPIIDVAYISGDGTVPERSARSFNADLEYKFSGLVHAQMSSTQKVREAVSSILLDQEISIVEDPSCEIEDSNLYSVRGPVKIDVPESVVYPLYEEIYDNTFLVVPRDEPAEIFITASSTGNFSAKVKRFRGGRVVSTSNFNNIRISSVSSTYNFVVEEEESDKIILISENDQGVTVLPDSVFEGDSLDDLTPPETVVNVVPGTGGTEITFVTDDEANQTYFATSSASLPGNEQFVTGTSTIISTPGTTTVYYYSVDTAGNHEEEKSQDVHIVESTVADNGLVGEEPVEDEIIEIVETEPVVTITKEPAIFRKKHNGGNKKQDDSNAVVLVDSVGVENEQNKPNESNESSRSQIVVFASADGVNNLAEVEQKEVYEIEDALEKTIGALSAAAIESSDSSKPGISSVWWYLAIILVLILAFALEQSLKRK